jgi:O-antigen ligase
MLLPVFMVVALVPLLITPGLLFYFDITPKIVVLLAGVSVMLLFCNNNVNNIRTLLRAAPGRWFAALLGAEWLSAVVSTVFSTQPQLSSNGSNWRRYGLVSETALLVFTLLSTAWLAADRRRIRRLLRLIAAGGAAAALYGISQYFGWDPLLPARSYLIGEGTLAIVRPPGPLGHADYFANWLLFVTFAGLVLESRSARVVSILAASAILLSGTRAALLGLLVGGVVFFALRRPRIGKREVALGLVSVACLGGFFVSAAGTKLRARLHWSLEDARGGARLLLWRDSLRMARDRTLIGFGPETFTASFPRYESVELARAYPDFYHESPHNMFLDALAAQGVFGVLPLFGLCGLALWSGRRGSRSGDRLAAPLTAALVAALVCQQFVVFVVPTALYFYLLLAVLVVMAAPTTPAETRKPSRLFLLPSVAVSMLFALFAVRLAIADRALAATQSRLEAGNARGAAEAYRIALRWQPSGAGSDLYYSRAMAQLTVRTPIFATRLDSWQQALEAGVRATGTSEDRQNAWYNLASLLASQNDAAGVERCLRNAIAWAPNWFKPHWTLAQVLEVTGRHEEGLAEAAAAVERDGGHDPEVSDTWKRLHIKH